MTYFVYLILLGVGKSALTVARLVFILNLVSLYLIFVFDRVIVVPGFAFL